jgi:hypothetical protein
MHYNQGMRGNTVVDAYVHVIAGLAVCSRIADVGTTYLVSPTLKLEANVIVRRFGWRFAFLTILVGLLAYVWPPLGVVIFTMSFLVAASNASKILLVRAIGEDEFSSLTRRVFLKTPLWPGLLLLVMPAFFIAALGGSMLLFYPNESDWGYYFGLGMLVYAFAILVWYPISYLRVRRSDMN